MVPKREILTLDEEKPGGSIIPVSFVFAGGISRSRAHFGSFTDAVSMLI